MPPPKSIIWQYFSKQDGNTCSKILKSSGNTTNLVAHLRQKHPKIYEHFEGKKKSVVRIIFLMFDCYKI